MSFGAIAVQTGVCQLATKRPTLRRIETPMSDETQLPEGIEFPTPPLRPDQLVDPAGHGLTWLWQGYLAQQKVAALISQSACIWYGREAVTRTMESRCWTCLFDAIASRHFACRFVPKASQESRHFLPHLSVELSPRRADRAQATRVIYPQHSRGCQAPGPPPAGPKPTVSRSTRAGDGGEAVAGEGDGAGLLPDDPPAPSPPGPVL